MIGSITKAFIEALRDSELVCMENVAVVIANDNGEGTVNTELPAIAVSVKGNAINGGQYIGGLLENEFIVQIIVITRFDNQNASPDMGHQYNDMNLSYKVMRYLNKVSNSDYFKQLRDDFDFSYTFRGIETNQTRGMRSEFEIEVFVHKLIYTVKIIDKETSNDNTVNIILPDGGVHMLCKCDEVKSDEMITYDKDTASTWER